MYFIPYTDELHVSKKLPNFIHNLQRLLLLSKFSRLTLKWYKYEVADKGILKGPKSNSVRWKYQAF